MPGRRFNTGSRQVSRRQTDWALGVSSIGDTAVAAGTKVLISSFPAATLTNFAPGTIVRTRGIISVLTDQIATSELILGAFGVAFVNETARALGVSAIPGPHTDPLFDGWFVHQYIMDRLLLADATGQIVGVRFIIDSKAMRKFDSDTGLVVMVENGNASFGFNISVGLRFLVKAG